MKGRSPVSVASGTSPSSVSTVDAPSGWVPIQTSATGRPSADSRRNRGMSSDDPQS